MLIHKRYRFRLYPEAWQEVLFHKTIGCCRFIYNVCLEQKTLDWHRSEPQRLTAFDQIKQLKSLKVEAPWLKDVPHHALQQAIMDLHNGFAGFFKGLEGYPVFKKKRSGGSFRLSDPKQIKIRSGAINLPKVGWVKAVLHREVLGRVKSATVSAIADDWYVSILTEEEIGISAPNLGAPVGVDIGVVNPIVLSDGTIFRLPRMGAIRGRIAVAQQAAFRRKKGSRNRIKAWKKVARLHAKFARMQRDAAHKATTIMVKNHGLIVLEDLKIANMTASARGTVESPGRNVKHKSGLNRSLGEIAPGTIRRMLEYKAPLYGSKVVSVHPAYTSQQCSACTVVDAASRVNRAQFICVSCGLTCDADVNAAKNILRLGAGGLPVMACESSRGGGRKQELSPAIARS